MFEKARWIGPAFAPERDFGVFVFRRRFAREEATGHRIWVSADPRFRLYLNGELVGMGPQRGDVLHWFFHEFELELQPGENVLHAVVWNQGRWAPMAQHTARTGFLLGGAGLDTGEKWECAEVPGWEFDMMFAGGVTYYIDIGPGERVTHPTPFSEWGTAPLKWEKPNDISGADLFGQAKGSTPWNLLPASLPPMRYEPNASHRLDLPRPLDRRHLIDFGELLCAYPRLRLRGPEGVRVTLTYQEAAVDAQGQKGNRNETEGKELKGYQDVIVTRAGDTVFEPLWWRTYRFVQIEADGPGVELVAFASLETGYPYEVESKFHSHDERLEKITEVSIRTAQRCAGETYFDCPYYEQLQYIGDTRIQALIGYYLSRDRRLQRNAIETLAWSRLPEGILQSRYPSRQIQVIPPFALWWIQMVRDAWMHDPGFDPKPYVPTVRSILAWFEENEGWWAFGDWVPGWGWGEPPGGLKHPIHRMTLALAQAAAKVLDPSYQPAGLQFTKEDRDQCEHTAALYRLLQIERGEKPDPWVELPASAPRCTYYFSYYKHLAQAAPDYYELLGPWHTMIENGLTTFAENPEPTRSDCHAWSAHPVLGFFQQVAGITSASPGWRVARISPQGNHPFEARLAHPEGLLRVKFDGNGFLVESPVPYFWQDERAARPPGETRFEAR